MAECDICAFPAEHWAVGACNHAVCHKCMLRIRILYRKDECPLCKTKLADVYIFDTPSLTFESLNHSHVYDVPSTSSSHELWHGVHFESETLRDSVVRLTDLTCPKSSCDFTSSSWKDWKKHISDVHHMLFCGLCVNENHRFPIEHELFKNKKQLHAHDDTVHIRCDLCHKLLYDSDALNAHTRESHEKCHVCEQLGSKRFFENFTELSKHFESVHYPCPDPACVLVVFADQLSLLNHMQQAHGLSVSQKQRLMAREKQQEDFFTSQAPRDSASSDTSTQRAQTVFKKKIPPADLLANLVDNASDEARPPIPTQYFSSDAKAHSFCTVLRAFLRSECSAHDLVSQYTSLFYDELQNLATIISQLCIIFPDREKAGLLKEAWKFNPSPKAPAKSSSYASSSHKPTPVSAGLSTAKAFPSLAQLGSSLPPPTAPKPRSHPTVSRAFIPSGLSTPVATKQKPIPGSAAAVQKSRAKTNLASWAPPPAPAPAPTTSRASAAPQPGVVSSRPSSSVKKTAPSPDAFPALPSSGPTKAQQWKAVQDKTQAMNRAFPPPPQQQQPSQSYASTSSSSQPPKSSKKKKEKILLAGSFTQF